MIQPGDFQAATALIAEAAVNADGWDKAMGAIADAAGACGALLLPYQGRLPTMPVSPSLQPWVDCYVRGGWIERDRRQGSLPFVLRRGVSTDLDFISPDEIRTHPYYQELLAPLGLRWFAGIKMAAGDDLWCLALQRTIAQGPFYPTEQDRLATLSHSLSAAAALSRALGFARAEAALDAFELSGTAIVLLDRMGQVVRMNAGAERLLGPELQVRHRRLTSTPDATRALDQALHRLLWSPTPAALSPPVVLPRRNRRPVLAYPARLSGIARDTLAPYQAVLVLTDLDRPASSPEALLRQVFALTPAEAKLAAALGDGSELTDVADQLDIAKETARVQLKAVFAKTHTHRQAELVALLGRISSLGNHGRGD
jgi:DNA-binding CsgD family transcriptional regulator